MQQVCFRLERGQEKSACRAAFILILHVKIAVIQSVRKAYYAVINEICNFWTFCPHLKAAGPNDSNSLKVHLIAVDMI